MIVDFHDVGRLPHENDNVAIAMRILEAGTQIRFEGETLTLDYTVLEGHRFAIRTIETGEALLSWSQPFGTAAKRIQAGNYVCSKNVLTELDRRAVAFERPAEPNFSDKIPPFVFDETLFQPAPALELHAEKRTFMGYRRAGNRGVGTRNMIVLLGTSALTAGFVRQLETQLKPLAAGYPHIDGIVAVAHSEGAEASPNNRDLLLRTLTGFMVHPNVGAVLVVDYAGAGISNAMLKEALANNGDPIDSLPHRFMSFTGNFQENLDAAAAVVKGWLETVNATPRTEEPLSELKIALQCGGSDAFSGVSGNPLAAWVAREVIRHGGSANMAETDELLGAERYMLDKVRDIDVARRFVSTLNRFQEWAGWHGHSGEQNPSGGNAYRGLYNIYLKSLGAAAKRHPDVRLDDVLDYGARMTEPGFYFMDSPGNDLESIAGQVAAGSNLIFFVTGNGSITNFPFVPTIKFVTTTPRYELLPDEMDVNAGAYLDGTPMDDLGAETFELTLAVANGQETAGEKAGHAQVQIWRNWTQTGVVALDAIRMPAPDGKALKINIDVAMPDLLFSAYQTERGYTGDQIGLILPTSLCSGQIARMCVDSLNEAGVGREKGISRFVSLVHTEGCGVTSEAEFDDTIIGYLQHPAVRHCMLLEHGCEKTHNGYMRQLIEKAGLDADQFGWASVQWDGGIQNSLEKMTAWFNTRLAADSAPKSVQAGLGAVKLALLTTSTLDAAQAQSLATLTRIIVAAGGTVIVPHDDALLTNTAYTEVLQCESDIQPTIAYAQVPAENGLHIMGMTSPQWVERLTGLGAAGADLIVAIVNQAGLPGHPLLPVLQLTARDSGTDFDGVLGDEMMILEQITATLSREYIPKQTAYGNTDFQITRGLLGVSM